MKKHILHLLLIFCGANLFAQGTQLPLYHNGYHILDRADIKYGKILPIPHTALKPVSRKVIAEHALALSQSNIVLSDVDRADQRYLTADNSEWIPDSLRIKSRKSVLKYFYREPSAFYSVHTKDFTLKINPVLGLHVGRESATDEFKFRNTRGLELSAYIKKKVGFYTYIGENQWRPMQHIQQRIVERDAVPNEGFYKEFGEPANGVDYFTARGYIDFNIIEHFDIQFGHDRHHIGNGYRSMFLSGHSNNMFFLKLNTRVWKLNYQNIFAELTHDYSRGVDRLLDKKYGVFHHLNINIIDGLDIGLFEGVILTRSNQFELQYLNPLIFYRSIEQDLGSPDNALLGLDFKYNFIHHFSFYGQFVVDEFNTEHVRARNGWWGNKFAVQLGLKYIDVAGIEGLDAQFEYNYARPFIYTHGGPDSSLANYTHYNQPIAHPLGANFREYITILRYQPLPKLQLQNQLFIMQTGLDTLNSHWGSNIFESTSGLTAQQEFENSTAQGVRTNIVVNHFLASYQFRHNMMADFNFTYRRQTSALKEFDQSNVLVSLGLRVNFPYQPLAF